MDEGISIIVAAILAIAGIFYTSRQQRKVTRKQHTYQVLDKLNDWAEFDQKLNFARAISRSGKKLTICDDDKEACDKIDFLLNYYEFLSSSIICGDIDEELVRHVEFERLTRMYLRFIYYIEDVRAHECSNTIWEDLEFICYRWKIERRDEFESLVDRFRLRPSSSNFRALREQISGQLKVLSDALPVESPGEPPPAKGDGSAAGREAGSTAAAKPPEMTFRVTVTQEFDPTATPSAE